MHKPIMMQKLLSSSRYLVIIAVAGTFLAALTLLLYGGISVVQLIADTVMHAEVSGKTGKLLALGFIESIDLFLLGTVFFIISLGLYELFIDDSIDLPDWLVIHTLDDLKNKLIGVIVVVMSVVFLGHVVQWHGEQELIWLGGAIALVTAGLTCFVGSKKK
ncbi:YqhA family protein [Chlorobaculum sp. MV4-Y]|uniref:YqhA family protein n=1 Tax=Chlorobaculum sp. MV4-Y TaxID=2976335 RepID=UPI0021B00522|nr:YqhA family protein [Chlorobaculum sp. MV4-Y]UWX57562.1 YqhA family protein [Chlorobaculum sp. MV4-Y]